jgi:hypothetical protein
VFGIVPVDDRWRHHLAALTMANRAVPVFAPPRFWVFEVRDSPTSNPECYCGLVGGVGGVGGVDGACGFSVGWVSGASPDGAGAAGQNLALPCNSG